MKFSQKSQNITPFYVMELLERAKEMEKGGKKIIHLEVGEPDSDTPQVIKDEMIKSLLNNRTRYTHSQGVLELREAIAEDYWNKYHVTVAPDQIIVTAGTSNALFLIFSLLLEEGREILLPKPYYACYPNFIQFLGGKCDYFAIKEEEGYQYNLARIRERIKDSTAGLLVNSPSNPTGTVQEKKILEELAGLNIPIVSDEIYQGLTYGTTAHSMLEFTNHSYVINGFSKLYAMTGWRLGYLIAPKNSIRSMQKMQQNFYISANEFVQFAGIAALKHAHEFVPEMVEEYRQRRELTLECLEKIGLAPSYVPQGAYYVLLDVSQYTEDSMAFAIDILEKTGVAVTPGLDFGVNDHIRITYANSKENIREGISRLGNYFEGL